ncbi:MAG: DUF86 domain-containing protein [Methanoregulaceae archaeon]
MKQREYTDYLHDILDAMEKAVAFSRDLSEKEFLSDEKTVYATVRALEIIGEAAKQIPKHLKQRYPDIPWREMMAVRGKVIHAYFGVDGSVIWTTVHKDIPPVIPLIRHIIREIEGT